MREQESLFPGEYPEASDNVPVKKNPKKKTAEASEKPTLKRRKKAQGEVADYYALLDVDADAAPAAIKRGYIEKIKQYPPETHPEEFQKIRKAYDNLRDTELRKQYDIVRTYGETVEDLLREATSRLINSQSIKLLERAVAIDPQHSKARLALAYAYIYSGKALPFTAQFNELKQVVSPDQWPEMWSNKITMLMQVGRVDDAFDELQKFKKANPKAVREFWDLYLEVYDAADCEGQLLIEIEAQVREIEAPAGDDIQLYAAWINLADALDEPGKLSKAQTAAQKFVKAFRNPEDVRVIVGILMEEYRKCYEDEDFDGAKMFIDLALAADKNNKELQQASIRIQMLNSMMNEVERATYDKKLFPLVLMDAIRWIAEEFQVLEDVLEEMECVFSDDFIEELQEMAEEYAAGIIYLKKKFPTSYRYYQQRWDALFKEKTAGLNREARRGLRL